MNLRSLTAIWIISGKLHFHRRLFDNSGQESNRDRQMLEDLGFEVDYFTPLKLEPSIV